MFVRCKYIVFSGKTEIMKIKNSHKQKNTAWEERTAMAEV